MRESATGEGHAPAVSEASGQTRAMPTKVEVRSGEESGLRGRVEETTTPVGSPSRRDVAATRSIAFGLETVAVRRATMKGLRGPKRPSVPKVNALQDVGATLVRRRRGRQTGRATSKDVPTMHGVASGQSR